MKLPEKLIMINKEETDSAHIVHRGGTKPPSFSMHQRVSWMKWTARPARNTLKRWHTRCMMTMAEKRDFWKSSPMGLITRKHLLTYQRNGKVGFWAAPVLLILSLSLSLTLALLLLSVGSWCAVLRLCHAWERVVRLIPSLHSSCFRLSDACRAREKILICL